MFRTLYGVGVDFTPFGERWHTSCTFGVSLWLVPHFYKDNLSLMFKKILAGATALTVASGAFTVASADVVDNLVAKYNDLGGGVWSVAGADAAQNRVDDAKYTLVSTQKYYAVKRLFRFQSALIFVTRFPEWMRHRNM